jgi:hypothetical protein
VGVAGWLFFENEAGFFGVDGKGDDANCGFAGSGVKILIIGERGGGWGTRAEFKTSIGTA